MPLEYRTYRDAGRAFKDNYLAFFKRSFVRKTASRADLPRSGACISIPGGIFECFIHTKTKTKN